MVVGLRRLCYRRKKNQRIIINNRKRIHGHSGCPEEFKACQSNYPGTYIAGLYNRLVSKVADRDIENEDFVNTQIGCLLTSTLMGKMVFGGSFKILSINRELNFKNGTLAKELIVQDSKAIRPKSRVRVSQVCLTSMLQD